jgi:pectin methylesterase-like acyl-CoA thioesterase
MCKNIKKALLFICLSIGFATQISAQTYDFTVAKDGTGNFKDIQTAIDSAPINRTTPFKIFIKNGKYKQKLTIPSNKPFIQLIGESVANVVLTWDDYSGKTNPAGGTFGTANSASTTVNANDFAAINITFENSTGDAPQALAINVNADRCAFKNCRFLGGQDTLLTNKAAGRQYFKNCYIDGTVDFIFGSAIAVFDSCIVYAKDRADATANSYITAANTPTGQNYGYVFRDCILPSNRAVTAYFLGRPWQNDGTTTPVSNTKVVLLNTKMGATINPVGWSTWSTGTLTNLILYAENKTQKLDGSAYDVSKRVTWSAQLSDADAAIYRRDTAFFSTWNPCESFADACKTPATSIAISNFKTKKGTSTTPSVFTWNPSWGIKDVKYEMLRSVDNKATFAPLYTVTAATDTAINFGTTDTVPLAGKTFFYVVRGTKTGLTTHISDTIEVSSIPTIISAGQLGGFLQGLGTPSNNQSYTFSGTNLLGTVTITPPVNFEISNNNGTTWFKNSTPLSISPVNNTIASTVILVRLNGTAVGDYTGTITHTSTGATTTNVAVSGKVQANALAVSKILSFYPFTTSGTDSVGLRSAGVPASAPTFSRMVVSNGIINGTAAAYPAYSEVYGQCSSSGTLGDGLWSAASGGPGGNLNRVIYEQFTISASPNYKLRVDSLILNASFALTASSTKLGVVYSKSNWASDSTDITGGIGADGLPLLSSGNGAFLTPIVLTQENTSTTANYRLAFNGATGVDLAAGQTLTVRLYMSCSSSSQGRYAKLKDLHFKGLSTNTTGTKETTPSVFTLNPNPATDRLVVAHPNLKEEALITIYNLNGVKMLSKKAINSDNTSMDISTLMSGIYLVECLKGTEKTVLKLIKH